MYFKTADVAGLRLFYREAGDPSKPTIVLLHGFPSSSYQFHDLIPRLADRFHVIAPEYPGMGFSDARASLYVTRSMTRVGRHFAPSQAPRSGTLGNPGSREGALASL
jgi:pimeloyl-ACP methyl ester carboxylesterase